MSLNGGGRGAAVARTSAAAARRDGLGDLTGLMIFLGVLGDRKSLCRVAIAEPAMDT